MNAHTAPVIMVIDPETRYTKEPKLTPYGTHVAFAAELFPWMNGIPRLQRDQAYREMEDTIRHEMEEEKFRAGHASRREREAAQKAIAAAHKAAITAAAERKRRAAYAAIKSAIAEGHDTFAALIEALGMSSTQLDRHLRTLRETGAVKVWKRQNEGNRGGAHNVYEVVK